MSNEQEPLETRPDEEEIESMIGTELEEIPNCDPDYYCNARKYEYEDEDVQEQQIFAGFCNNRAGFKTDHVGVGRCKYHGGLAGPPEGNNNGEKHGLYANRSNYYSNRTDAEKEWIDQLVRSMLNDAPFGADNFQKFQMLREIAIDMHKKRQANDYTAEEGIIQENVVRDDEGNPIMRDGELVTDTEENPVNLAYDRLDRTLTRKMKELGLLDDPDSQKAESNNNIADSLSAIRAKMESDDE